MDHEQALRRAHHRHTGSRHPTPSPAVERFHAGQTRALARVDVPERDADAVERQGARRVCGSVRVRRSAPPADARGPVRDVGHVGAQRCGRVRRGWDDVRGARGRDGEARAWARRRVQGWASARRVARDSRDAVHSRRVSVCRVMVRSTCATIALARFISHRPLSFGSSLSRHRPYSCRIVFSAPRRLRRSCPLSLCCNFHLRDLRL